jgi:hypothetical protein
MLQLTTLRSGTRSPLSCKFAAAPRGGIARGATAHHQGDEAKQHSIYNLHGVFLFVVWFSLRRDGFLGQNRQELSPSDQIQRRIFDHRIQMRFQIAAQTEAWKSPEEIRKHILCDLLRIPIFTRNLPRNPEYPRPITKIQRLHRRSLTAISRFDERLVRPTVLHDPTITGPPKKWSMDFRVRVAGLSFPARVIPFRS